MKIEIWSDIMCPFCYIGKRNFENALEQFPDKDKIEIEWKSYQLDPAAPEVAVETQEDYLVKNKGMSRSQVKGMMDNVTEMAAKVGLEYHLDQSLMVNTQKAHQLIQFAKTKNLANELEERLFKAFFTEGKNIADLKTLTELGKEIGLDENELQAAFTDEKFLNEMKKDVKEGQELGVRGVPFFVLDRKYGVSGAQPPQVFLENLTQAYSEWREANPEVKLNISEGQSCSADGTCD